MHGGRFVALVYLSVDRRGQEVPTRMRGENDRVEEEEKLANFAVNLPFAEKFMTIC